MLDVCKNCKNISKRYKKMSDRWCKKHQILVSGNEESCHEHFEKCSPPPNTSK